MDEHRLGQCACGQYHLTVNAAPVAITTASHWLKSWHEVEPPTSYEGKHRSE